ncbi:hypothetical protein AVEN_141859-1 [Araneus ventricosus]|uniref:Uncharacterized protein n=1 Tax=Araneus ventricosus TaxID=182803 RepID=A0A4Y2L3C9_ARAVE|nr:hypothetical protein AVEN_141859-1 [Araneus ventricosus]
MSLHSPARRTRSDPGSPDQPSRIPRPISSANRSSIPVPNNKGAPKALRSPKINVSKKFNTEISKSNPSLIQSEVSTDESIISQKSSDLPTEVDLNMDATEILESKVDSEPLISDEQQTDFADFTDKIEKEQLTNGTHTLFEEEVDEDEVDLVSSSSSGSKEMIVEDCITNPFCQDDKNPFRVNGESKNPFITSSNPFEEYPSESTPALQPKAQISAAVKAPPIPERNLSEHRTNLFKAAGQKSRPQFSAAVFTSLSEENIVPDKCLKPILGAKSGLYGMTADFSLEILQQFFSFESSMGVVMKEDDTITQHARAFVSDGFTMPQ